MKKEETLSVTRADYLGGYKVLVWFSNGCQRIIDFKFLFLKFAEGHYNKWLLPANFRKFIVQDGNLYWGKNEDVIFPVSFLYTTKHSVTQKEEILYVL